MHLVNKRLLPAVFLGAGGRGGAQRPFPAPLRCGRQLLMPPWQLSSSPFLIIITLFREINVPGQSTVRPVKCDVNKSPQDKLQAGKRSRAFPCLSECSGKSSSILVCKEERDRSSSAAGLGQVGGRHICQGPLMAHSTDALSGVSAPSIRREGGLVFNIIIIPLLWYLGRLDEPDVRG